MCLLPSKCTNDSGKAITILTSREVYHFKQTYAKLHNVNKPKKIKFDLTNNQISVENTETNDGNDLVTRYEEALESLEEKVIEEKKSKLSGKAPKRKKELSTLRTDDSIPENLLPDILSENT